jgi:Family of unknown function (DUF6582)
MAGRSRKRGSTRKSMKKSSAKGTKRLKSKQFAYPSKRAYPINTKKRARAALSRAAQSKTSGTYAHVAKAVKAKYPGIKTKGSK